MKVEAGRCTAAGTLVSLGPLPVEKAMMPKFLDPTHEILCALYTYHKLTTAVDAMHVDEHGLWGPAARSNIMPVLSPSLNCCH